LGDSVYRSGGSPFTDLEFSGEANGEAKRGKVDFLEGGQGR